MGNMRPQQITDAIFAIRRIPTKTASFFLGHLMSKPIREATGGETDTMATDGSEIVYCREWVEQHESAEIAFIMLHEVCHMRLNHPARLDKMDIDPNNRQLMRLVNIAADLSINPPLLNACSNDYEITSVRAPIPTLSPRDFGLPLGETMEWYYAQLKGRIQDDGTVKTPETGDGKWHPNSQQHDDYLQEQIGDTGEAIPGGVEPGSSCDEAKAIAEAQGLKAGTSGNTYIAKMILGDLKPHIDWRQALDHLLTVDNTDYTWSRPNRRYLGLPIPALHDEQLPEVVILVDVSGSINMRSLRTFLTEVYGILQATPKRALIATHNTAIRDTWMWSPSDGEADLTQLHVGGGTSHETPLAQLPDIYRQYDMDPCSLIMFTDACSHWPSRAPEIPTICIVMEEDQRQNVPSWMDTTLSMNE